MSMKRSTLFGELIQNKKFKYLLLAFITVLPFEILSFFSIHLPKYIELPLFLTLIVIFGRNVFKSGFESLFRLRFSDMNLLMTIAIFGAIYLQEWEEAVIIVILFALGNTLEDFGIERSQSALQTLIDSTPKTAQIKGAKEKTPVKEIKVGNIIVIKPGDQIPLDGKVVAGMSLVDEATITGEPLPHNKHINDLVYAGTINGNGYMEILVTKTVADSTLSKIIELTYSSAEKKSHSQKFIEKFATYYTPVVISGAFLLILIPVGFLGHPFTPWFTQALTLLIIACPCALVISTPITIFSAIGNATKRGVLIKGGRYIEEMGKIRALAFDKTRTLTKGEATVSDVITFNGHTQKDVLACASGIESFSEHPLAQSVIKEAKKYGLDPHTFTNFEAVSGKGLKGDCLVCTDKHHCLGSIKFITQEHEVEDKVMRQVELLEKQGKTAVIMSDNEKVAGIIGITDEIRDESKDTIARLIQLQITPVILTGDNYSSASFVAEKLGIKKIKASLLPNQKVAELSKLISKYTYVGMVGDGVNDAPSLATASVGIVMGAIGSDIAIENADVALMTNNLALIPFLVKLGKKSVQTIRINTTAAISVKFLFLLLALLGKSNLTLAIFADVGVTILVVLNSLQLFQFKEHI